MTTSIDTNIVAALWSKEPGLPSVAGRALSEAHERGRILVCAPVFAELLAAPGRDEAFVNQFLDETGIEVDWLLEESVWRAAGRAFQANAAKRRKHREPGSRRLLVDFLIGAHAQEHSYHLLTLDDRFYRKEFPKVVLVDL